MPRSFFEKESESGGVQQKWHG